MKNSCQGCKRYWNHLHGKVTRFVRRMSKSSRHCMVIPERFANHFVGKMSRTVKLEGPNGIVYDVGVTEHRHTKVLQSGWEVFVDANDIVKKDSLMFRYCGSSRFKVAVFDSSGCEKTVSCFGIGSTMSDQEPITNSTEMSSSSSDRNTHSSMGRPSDGCQSESSGHCRELARTDATSSPSENLSGEDSPYEHESSGSDDHTLPKPLFVLSGQCYVTDEQEENIVALVQEIQPQMPLLVAMMKKPNVKPYPDLVIPKDYAMTYFPHESQTITLQLAKQSKAWRCKFRVIPDGGRCNLYWCYFVRDNQFLEGDLCLLQPMSNGEGTTFTVIVHVLRKASIDHSSARSPVSISDHCSPSTKMISIVRVKEEQYSDASGRSDRCQSGSSSYSGSTRKTAIISTPSAESGPPKDKYVLASRSYLAEAQKEKIDMLLQDIRSRTLAFVAIMKKSNVRPLYPSLTITKEYAVAHFPHESASVIFQRPDESKKWYPRFFKGNDGSPHKIRGEWLDFVCDNHVEEGDICIFVPAKGGGRFTFTVHLLRAESKVHAGPFVLPYILPQMSFLSPLQQRIVEDKAQAIQLEAHLYVAIMNKTSVGVEGNYILEFAAKYAAVYLPKEERTILLQRKGKEWQTQMRIRNGRRRVLEGGWRKFVSDNRLRVGDICLFELKRNRRKLTMIVHIISRDLC